MRGVGKSPGVYAVCPAGKSDFAVGFPRKPGMFLFNCCTAAWDNRSLWEKGINAT